MRTHTCGELTAEHVGDTVTLCGWVDTYRDHGGSLFIDLRDRYGKTQVVFSPESGEAVVQLSRTLRSEYVIRVSGQIAHRPEGTVNPKLATGEIELRARQLELLNRSEVCPVQPSAKDLPGEKIRLEYRYLDLRRGELQTAMRLRHRITKTMRDYCDELGFIEIETPILGRSTPEGARDYLVPSRVHPAHFYALPQSPQLYKQILMIAGYDRYMQIARCFRDEDLRADRQPEFTQLDLEMSFVEADDVMAVIDGLVARVAREVLGLEVETPLPRMTYDEAMRRFGHDAPDLRYGMEIFDVTDFAAQTDFQVFRQVAEAGNYVRGLCAPGGCAKYTTKVFKELEEFVRADFGCQGLAFIKVQPNGELTGPGTKIGQDFLPEIVRRADAKPGDMLFFIAGSWDLTCKALNGLRRRIAKDLQLYQPGQMHFSWVVEFPMFEWNEDENRWDAMHHPFTAPRPQDVPTLAENPQTARAVAYDLVINGSEAGGGTIRIHDAATQSQVFQLLGIDQDSAKERFGFLLDALQFGAPPHGGIALGVDRWVMLFAGVENIRDVIAFPKTQQATDLMTEAPGSVEERQLQELHVRVVKPK